MNENEIRLHRKLSWLIIGASATMLLFLSVINLVKLKNLNALLSTLPFAGFCVVYLFAIFPSRKKE